VFDKHKPYLTAYQPNDLFWGLGIENETYMQFDTPILIPRGELLNVARQKSERYSVNYFRDYKPGVFNAALARTLTAPLYALPVLMNSHSFQRTDIHGEPRTRYAKGAPPNSKFSGKSLYDQMCEMDPWFKDEYERKFIFDGDTIEFVTQNFYKARAPDVVRELLDTKQEFIDRLRPILAHLGGIYSKAARGVVGIANKNHGIATFMTNFGNIGIFNNMTYHINITLPSRLDQDARIADPGLFIAQHRNGIRWMQWILPMLIAEYGSPDFLSRDGGAEPPLAIASQRCALSRYIGVGTFDTRTMETGKLLAIPYADHPAQAIPFWWYKRYAAVSGYVRHEIIGCDFNWNKHPNHGIELRILDWFPEERLHILLRILILLMDHSLSRDTDTDTDTDNPVECEAWNDWVLEITLKGKDAIMAPEMREIYESMFGLHLAHGTSKECLETIHERLETLYAETGACAQRML
jgi:hypothetical protein